MPDTPTSTVLVVDDEPNLRRVLGGILRREGYAVVTAEDGQRALDLLRTTDVTAVITDLRMPRVDGMALLARATTLHPDVPVVILTAHGSVDNAVQAVKAGAFDYIEKPFERDQIREVVAKAVRTHELRLREARLRDGTGSPRGRYGLVGTSDAMQAVYNVIEKVAGTPSTVLITGESGTGKELVARAIHEQSTRREGPLIKVNCAAIPETLIESELFGHERGAFTGATSTKPGRFELAHEGTLFLDEVGEIPLEMQVKLLRALQESEFERVGGIKTLRVDTRVIAATNRNLEEAIGQGRFREDLYYRLNVVPLALPPLRERTDDLPDLVDHILARFRERLGKPARALTPRAMAAIKAYGWPGNIRELENLLERTVLFSDGELLDLPDLPPAIQGAAADLGDAAATAGAAPPEDAGLKEIVRAETERVERTLIQQALEQTGGNVTHAARMLRISRKSLQNKMKELGLRKG